MTISDPPVATRIRSYVGILEAAGYDPAELDRLWQIADRIDVPSRLGVNRAKNTDALTLERIAAALREKSPPDAAPTIAADLEALAGRLRVELDMPPRGN